MARPPLRRWPIEPLLAAAHLAGLDSLAHAIDEDTREVYRWQAAGGITDTLADRAAVRLGLLPVEVWTDWCDVVDLEPHIAGEEAKRARARSYAAEWRRANAEAVADYQARYRQLHAESKARYARSYYRRNREQLIAKQLERQRRRRHAS